MTKWPPVKIVSTERPSQYVNPAVKDIPVRDQGERNTSVGNAIAYCYDLMAKRAHNPPCLKCGKETTFVREYAKNHFAYMCQHCGEWRYIP